MVKESCFPVRRRIGRSHLAKLEQCEMPRNSVRLKWIPMDYAKNKHLGNKIPKIQVISFVNFIKVWKSKSGFHLKEIGKSDRLQSLWSIFDCPISLIFFVELLIIDQHDVNEKIDYSKDKDFMKKIFWPKKSESNIEKWSLIICICWRHFTLPSIQQDNIDWKVDFIFSK